MKSLADEMSDLFHNFGKISACLPLEDYGDHKEAYVRTVYTINKVCQGIGDTDAEVDLIQSIIELRAERIVKLIRCQPHTCGERMSGSHGAGNHVESLRQLTLELGHPSLFLNHQINKRNGSNKYGKY